MTYAADSNAAIVTIDNLFARADGDIAARDTQLAADAGSITSLRTQLDKALADLAACQGGHNPPPPAAPLYGSNNITRWPHSKVLRQFTPDGSYVLPNSIVPLWQWSNKSPLGGEASDIRAWGAFGVSGAEMGWAASVHAKGQRTHRIKWHEWDGKTRQNNNTTPYGLALSDWQKMQQAGIDYYANDPLITWVVVLTAFALSIPGEVDRYIGALKGLKCIGFDYDGSRPTKLPYVDYTNDIAEMVKWKAKGYDVCVPEFGVPGVTVDAQGAAKASWLVSTAHALTSAGASSVALFDSPPEGPLSGLPGTAWDAVLNA